MRVLSCLLFAALLGAPFATAAPNEEDLAWAREIVESRLADAEDAPDLPVEKEWLNTSRPLSLKGDLKGKVVVLDFWCYCCINCLHVLPDLEYLERKYAKEAFAVVGVHSAKFENERDVESIREAVRRYDIRHPVINDFDFGVWNAYHARAWPTLVVITPDGKLLGGFSGEGHRAELDALVAVLLDHYEDSGLLNTKPLPIRLENASRPPGALAYPGKVHVDAAHERLFIADTNHHRILEVGLDGTFRRAFGSGEPGLEDGSAGEARFRRPQGMDLADGTLYVADTSNHALRAIDLETGAVTTLAGDGIQGRRWVWGQDEARPSRRLSSPWDVLVDGDRLILAMAGPHQIWQYSLEDKQVRILAGDGRELRADHYLLGESSFAQPSALVKHGDWIYIADSESSAIVRMGVNGPVETLAGASENPRDLFHYGDEDGKGYGKRFQHPLGLAWHEDRLFVADSYNHKIKVLDPETKEVQSVLGTSLPGFSDADGTFSEPGGIDVGAGFLWVADTNNHAIRKVDLETMAVSTLVLQGVPIPQRAARAGASAPFAELRAQETRTLDAQTVRAGAETSLQFELVLPEGWKLTPESPSGIQFSSPAGTASATLEETVVSLSIDVLEGEQPAQVKIRAYVCQEDGQCRLHAVDLAFALVGTAAGPAQLALTDAFVP